MTDAEKTRVKATGGGRPVGEAVQERSHWPVTTTSTTAACASRARQAWPAASGSIREARIRRHNGQTWLFLLPFLSSSSLPSLVLLLSDWPSRSLFFSSSCWTRAISSCSESIQVGRGQRRGGAAAWRTRLCCCFCCYSDGNGRKFLLDWLNWLIDQLAVVSEEEEEEVGAAPSCHVEFLGIVFDRKKCLWICHFFSSSPSPNARVNQVGMSCLLMRETDWIVDFCFSPWNVEIWYPNGRLVCLFLFS